MIDRYRQSTPQRAAHWVGVLAIASVLACGGTVRAAETPAPLPPDAVVVGEAQAGGAQVYRCAVVPDGTFAWTLIGPKALLVGDDGTDFGTHSAGPMWTAVDGSSITADGAHPLEKVARPQSVPALLLRVTGQTGTGVLSGVRFVRRADTEGGLPPPGGCDAAHTGAVTARHYSAIYTFYK
jgi:hypothetical protein